MEVDADKEYRGTVGVQISDESAICYVSADVCDGGERGGDVGGVVYG